MRCGYFDCFSGAAGDMILASMVDAGCPVEVFAELPQRLKLGGVKLSAERVHRHGLAAVHVRVEVSADGSSGHRHLHQILRILDEAELSPAVRERAACIFRRLAEAEAAVHGVAVEKVHFHEVGAADAIVDIVGACAGIERLGLERVRCSPLPTGHGAVDTEHGVMPVPAPATVRLLEGVPLAACEEPGELTTPTGAAILTTIAEGFGPLPAMRLVGCGTGAGTREGRTRPNVLRLMIGELDETGETDVDTVCVLETQVDDAAGQNLAYACERLLEAGALDVYVVPIMMKKGRPGELLTVLCRPDDETRVADVLFAETGTLGIRRRLAERSKLRREVVRVATRFGILTLKVARRGGRVLRAWPEYEACAAAARQHRVPLRQVQEEALRAWAAQPEPPRPAE